MNQMSVTVRPNLILLRSGLVNFHFLNHAAGFVSPGELKTAIVVSLVYQVQVWNKSPDQE